MEFVDGQVVHETQYFSNSFPAPESRADLAEAIPHTGTDGSDGEGGAPTATRSTSSGPR